MAAGRPFLSVIIPAYNEAQRLPATIPLVVEFLSAQGYTHEIIVVDDGSTDHTPTLYGSSRRDIHGSVCYRSRTAAKRTPCVVACSPPAASES